MSVHLMPSHVAPRNQRLYCRIIAGLVVVASLGTIAPAAGDEGVTPEAFKNLKYRLIAS